MSDSPIPELTPATVGQTRSIVWILIAILVTTLSIVIGVALPDRIKLFGLFPIFWGGLLGIGLRRLANKFHVKPNVWPTLLVCFLIAAGEIGMVLGGWWVYRSDLMKQFEKIPSLRSLQQPRVKTQSNSTLGSKEIAIQREFEAEFEATERQSQQVQLQLSTFLYRRIAKLGDFSTPWPEVFWACEIAFGTFAGFWCWKYLRNWESL